MFDQIQNAPTVSELLAHIKSTLEETFHEVMVEGEISGISHAHSGHCYFNIMDQDASISCALFKQDLMRHPGFKNIKEGDKVLIYGPLTVYPKRGTFQILVKRVAPVGAGLLKMKFEALKKKLSSEGLFDLDRKRPIPRYPKKIALITAPGGAALHDFVNVYRRRGFDFQVTIIPALVQGDRAPSSLIAALKRAQDINADVIVLTRGGGSPEDLWCFNDEALIRQIALSTPPVISAVGHEVDWTLSDFVSDLRCETPTAAAETLTQPQTELKRKVQLLNQRLVHHLSTQKAQVQLRLTRYHPAHLMQALRERISDLRERLSDLNLAERSHQYIGIHERSQEVDELMRSLELAAITKVTLLSQRLEFAQARLLAMNPRSVLQRGYAIVSHNEKVISSLSELERHPSNSRLTLEFGDGAAHGTWTLGEKP